MLYLLLLCLLGVGLYFFFGLVFHLNYLLFDWFIYLLFAFGCYCYLFLLDFVYRYQFVIVLLIVCCVNGLLLFGCYFYRCHYCFLILLLIMFLMICDFNKLHDLFYNSGVFWLSSVNAFHLSSK